MPIKKVLSSAFSSLRQIIRLAIAIGLLAALLFASASTYFLHSQREASYQELAVSLDNYLMTFFNNLHATVDELHPLLNISCARSNRQLTTRAAFVVNVRAFLLVRNGVAYCSSATGDMAIPMRTLSPELDLGKEVDLVIQPGTPMMPNKPMIGAWFRSPSQGKDGVYSTISINLMPHLLFNARQKDITSVALVIGNRALSSQESTAVSLTMLPADPTRIIQIGHYPIKLYIYGTPWPAQDIQLSVLASLVFGLLVGGIAAYILVVRARPGKEVLTGIRQGQFYVVYQPVVDSKSLKTQGVEVLMRWNHPVAGSIPPDAFISFAEAQRLIVPLTRHLFGLIIRDAPLLKRTLPEGSKLAINLAPSHLYSSSFKADILKLSASLPRPHFQIVFEITERDMLQEKEAMDIFSWLHWQGFDIAVDDFGTGHSALIYLERFTLDYLKIDRGFVNTIGVDTLTAPVLDAVMTLAHRLNMKTVAEGVETLEQARWLIGRGVNYLQGYYFARPMTCEAFAAWYRKHPDFLTALKDSNVLEDNNL